ncbi:type II secretion system protein [Duganella callida]|uniref:Type II secretion system protein n=1 Tax=Duganella callida TaxID=2561932 RepID=A0A4Y9SGA7_9BURK|nr:type II secretion system protein [Duganella callida]TFW22919.1 type II secretion system protein [Duganella callida]
MAPRRLRRAGGFTYLSLIILVAILALTAAATLKMGSLLQRSKAEEELLDIGAAFSDALKSYADATPAGMPPQPPSLKELLRDPRFPGTRRHLRKIFVDPMTGKAEWGITWLGDKVGVLAVYSLSDAKPVKIGNFPTRFAGFEGKNRLSEWKFVMATEGAHSAAAPEKPGSASPLVPNLQQTPAAPISLPVSAPEKGADQPPPPSPVSEEPAAPSENEGKKDEVQPPTEPEQQRN